jgi:TonB family protein
VNLRKPGRRRGCLVSILASLLVTAAASRAGAAGPFAAWNRDLQKAIHDLETGDSKKASKLLDRLFDVYLQEAGPTEANERNLGTLLLYRAIAEQGLGQVDDARWDLDLASNFLPGVADFDLSRFGPAGNALHAYAQIAPDFPQIESDPALADHEVEPPRVTKRVRPKYTFGGKVFETEGELQVDVVIDKQGRASHPRVIRKLENPALSYAALEALRQWEFEPATLDGHPVEVFYNLTVNYRLRR